MDFSWTDFGTLKNKAIINRTAASGIFNTLATMQWRQLMRARGVQDHPII